MYVLMDIMKFGLTELKKVAGNHIEIHNGIPCVIKLHNPTDNDVKVHVGGKDTIVKVSVFSEKGDLIYTRYQDIADESRKTNIDLVNQVPGTYIVILESKTVRKTFKVIRE